MCWTANSTWASKFGSRRRVRGAHGVFGSNGRTNANDTTATTADTTTS